MILRKYGTLTVTGTTAIRIPIIKRAVVDFAVGADWTPAAGDVKIAIDGAAAANVTNLPTAVAMGNTAYWEFILTAAELTCKSCVVTVADSATKVIEDQSFIVETFGHASAMYQADLSAANLPANVTQLLGTAWLTPVVAGTPDVNTKQVSGSSDAADTLELFTGVLKSDTGQIDDGTFAADAIDGNALATSAAAEIRTGLATATNVSDAQTAIITQVDANETKIDAVKAKTDNLPSDPADQSIVIAATDAILSAVALKATQASVDDLPTNAELATALGTADDAVLAAIALEAIKTSAIQAVTVKLDTGLVLDGAVYQFTANMLELGPAGGGGGALTEDQAAQLTAIESKTNLITSSTRITIAADSGSSITLKCGDDYAGSTAKRIEITDADSSLYDLLRDNTLTARAFGAGLRRDAVTGTFSRDTITHTAASGSIAAYTTIFIECSVGTDTPSGVTTYDVQITDADGRKHTPFSGQCTLIQDFRS